MTAELKNAELADSTEGVALNIALGIDLKELRDSFTMVAERARTQPRAVLQATQYLGGELFAIMLGRSDIDAAAADSRFEGEAWHSGEERLSTGEAPDVHGKVDVVAGLAEHCVPQFIGEGLRIRMLPVPYS